MTLVEQLREMGGRLRPEAADEIEKLQADITSLNKALTLCSEGNAALKASAASEPVAVVGEQADMAKLAYGQFFPAGGNIKVIHPLKDLPIGTALFTAPPTALIEAARQALDALENLQATYREAVGLHHPYTDNGYTIRSHNAIAALRRELEKCK